MTLPHIIAPVILLWCLGNVSPILCTHLTHTHIHALILPCCNQVTACVSVNDVLCHTVGAHCDATVLIYLLTLSHSLSSSVCAALSPFYLKLFRVKQP